MNETPYGAFINPTPLDLKWIEQVNWGWLWRVDIWEYTANPDNPMMFIDSSGTLWRPDRHFFTDFGSIPPFLNGLPTFSRTRFLQAYLMHDSSYRFGGLWARPPGVAEYRFCALKKVESDWMLHDMIRAMGGKAAQAWVIYRAVRLARCQYPTGDTLRREP